MRYPNRDVALAKVDQESHLPEQTLGQEPLPFHWWPRDRWPLWKVLAEASELDDLASEVSAFVPANAGLLGADKGGNASAASSNGSPTLLKAEQKEEEAAKKPKQKNKWKAKAA